MTRDGEHSRSQTETVIDALNPAAVRYLVVGGVAGLAMKRGIGRPRDLEDIAALEALDDGRGGDG